MRRRHDVRAGDRPARRPDRAGLQCAVRLREHVLRRPARTAFRQRSTYRRTFRDACRSAFSLELDLPLAPSAPYTPTVYVFVVQLTATFAMLAFVTEPLPFVMVHVWTGPVGACLRSLRRGYRWRWAWRR